MLGRHGAAGARGSGGGQEGGQGEVGLERGEKEDKAYIFMEYGDEVLRIDGRRTAECCEVNSKIIGVKCEGP